jgi:hypothetical protein
MKTTQNARRQFLAGAAIAALLSAAPASADVVTDWNALTLSVANTGHRPAPAIGTARPR